MLFLLDFSFLSDKLSPSSAIKIRKWSHAVVLKEKVVVVPVVIAVPRRGDMDTLTDCNSAAPS